MPPNLPACGPVRSAAVVNAEIRRLWVDPRVRLSEEQRAVYELLIAEWAAAVKAEVVETAFPKVATALTGSATAGRWPASTPAAALLR
jgi:hypothetical protein